MVRAKSIPKPAGRASIKGPTALKLTDVQPELHVVTVELRCALSGIAVAVRALREQNADLDADIAIVLQRASGGPLHSALEKLECLLGASGREEQPTRQPHAAGRVH